MLVVEPPRPEDRDQVANLAASALHLPLGDRRLEGCVIARDVPSNRVVGVALAERGEALDAHLVALAVDEQHRGHGIGSALLRDIGHRMGQQGMRTMDLEVRADDPRARAFYGRHGYAPVGLQNHVYADGADAVRLQRPL